MRQEEFDLGIAAEPVQQHYRGYTITHSGKGTGDITHVSDPDHVIDTVKINGRQVKQALVGWHRKMEKPR